MHGQQIIKKITCFILVSGVATFEFTSCFSPSCYIINQPLSLSTDVANKLRFD